MAFVMPPAAEIVEVQDQLLATEHYLQIVKDLDRAIASPTKRIGVDELRQQKAEATRLLMQAYCRDVETEFVRDPLDIKVCTDAIRRAFSFAKVSSGLDLSGPLWAEFRAWQASMAQKFEKAVSLMVQSYLDTVDEELQKTEPDRIMIKQWWTLATGFAPELEDTMAEKYHQEVLTFCTSFMNKAAAELEKPTPDFVQIDRWMITFNNYTEHLQGTTLLAEIQAVQIRVDAAKAARQES